MPNDHGENVAETYLALRLATVLLVGLLFLSVALQIGSARCFLGSISAFYYTPTRSVFIAALAAIGACLIVYRGNTDTENVLLDFCGFFAFAVAFVPTPLDDRCPSDSIPSPEEVAIAVTNNLTALFVVGLIATFVGRWLLKRQGKGGERLSKNAKASTYGFGTTLVIGLAIFRLQPDLILRWGHGAAASGLFVCIVAVVMVNAFGFAQENQPEAAQGQRTSAFTAVRNRYGLVAVGMVVTLVGLLSAGWLADFDKWLLVLEAALIFEFAVFWILQTIELKGNVAR